jgi:hypothetical protein
MLTKFKIGSLQAGLFIVALSVGACSSSPSSTGAGGSGGGAAGSAGGAGGAGGVDAAAGTGGGTDAAAGTDGGGSDVAADTSTDVPADTGTDPNSVNLSLINATTTGGLDPSITGTPKDYATCH